jgi:cytochrome c oxidase cbb3-type subunit III
VSARPVWLLFGVAALPVAAAESDLPPASTMASIPLGDVPGDQQLPNVAGTANPLAKEPRAIEMGKRLYIAMNCADCHGYDAKGAMGPNLTDNYWRYGGTPAAVYNSIAQGRPQGMPAWGTALPPIEIWRLTAYIESLGGTFPAEKYQQALEGDLAQGKSSAQGQAQAVQRGRR